MNKSALVILLATAMLLCNGCAYRVSTPQALPSGLQIVIVENNGRLVQAQTHLQQAIASELEKELAWSIKPQSMNQLLITINPESIKSSAKDKEQITTRWRNTLKLSVVFKSPYIKNGSATKKITGSASHSSLLAENKMLINASENAARNIRHWLEAMKLQTQPPAP